MRDRAAFAYAHARLQAHHGRRPTKSTWHFLNASKSLGHYLESARKTGLGAWAAHLTTGTDIHDIEGALRREWQAYVERVSSWLPRDWRPAVLWTQVLADLPLAVHHGRGLATPAWGEADVARLQDGTSSEKPLSDWVERFNELWPQGSDADARELKQLIDVLRYHLAPDNPDYILDGVEARYSLIARLERLFRRHAQRPVAVFAFLGMVALDIEHLRAHLVHRRLFPETLDNR